MLLFSVSSPTKRLLIQRSTVMSVCMCIEHLIPRSIKVVAGSKAEHDDLCILGAVSIVVLSANDCILAMIVCYKVCQKNVCKKQY